MNRRKRKRKGKGRRGRGGFAPCESAGPVQIPWNGRDEDFNAPASGVYLYKLRVAVDGERRVSEHIEKLAIIR